MMLNRSHILRRAGLLQLLAAGANMSCAAHDNLVVGRAPDRGAVEPSAGTPLAPNLPAAATTATPAGVIGAAGTTSTTPVAARAPIGHVSIDQTHSDNPAGLSPSDVKTLIAGGPLGDMKWLYPYDGTVFPRGTITPLVMWHGSAAPDAVYFHMKSQAFEYKGVLKPAAEAGLVRGTGVAPVVGGLTNAVAGESQTQLAIPQDVWDRAGQQTLGRTDPFTLELTERVNGVIHGPLVSHITIAQANVKGSIYYNTCASSLTDASATETFSAFTGVNGRVLRIPAGGKAELVLQLDKCHGCHSVSADGSRLLAQAMPTQGNTIVGAAAQDPNYAKGQAMSWQLGVDGKALSTAGNPVGGNASYSALYPDGSKYLTTAVLARPVTGGNLDEAGALTLGVGFIKQWGGYDGNSAAAFDFSPAALYDASSGQVVSDTGIPAGAMMPMFSPDGTRLAFNDVALNDARGLAVMAYDTHVHKASDYRQLTQEASTGTLRPGWPAFLPDNSAVVFVRTKTKSFTSDAIASSTTACANLAGGCGIAAFTPPAADGGSVDSSSELLGKTSDLYIADMHTGAVSLLAKAMGFDSPEAADTGPTYLPFGAQDLHHNYFPTVSPVAAGGYFWVFFDTRRNFGSLGMQRALWGFAIDIQPDGNYAHDPSHPPFYLPGQEFGTSSNNHRAFAALDRCKVDRAVCTTGIDCCSGRCEDAACAAPPDKNSCARTDERCASAASCCDKANYCINGFCAVVELL